MPALRVSPRHQIQARMQVLRERTVFTYDGQQVQRPRAGKQPSEREVLERATSDGGLVNEEIEARAPDVCARTIEGLDRGEVEAREGVGVGLEEGEEVGAGECAGLEFEGAKTRQAEFGEEVARVGLLPCVDITVVVD